MEKLDVCLVSFIGLMAQILRYLVSNKMVQSKRFGQFSVHLLRDP